MSEQVSRSIGQILEHAKIAGDAQEQAHAMLADLAEHVREYGGKAAGRLTITLDVTVDRDGVEMKSRVKTKTPEPPPVRAVGFLTPDCQLTRRDPRQPDLPLRDYVPREPAIVDRA